LREIDPMNGWTSRRLGICFQQDASGELTVYHPDGRRFLTFVEVEAERQREAEARRQEAEARRQEAEARKLAEDAAEKLRQQLKALGIDPQA
jgi:hypothetical protein